MAASSGPKTTIKQAIQLWEDKMKAKAKDGEIVPTAAEAEVVKLYMQLPPIDKMDASLAMLENVTFLSLSTNCITRIEHLNGLHHIKTLSLARNNIKKIENLEPIRDTLENLWLSYNQIDKIAGVTVCKNLKQLYLRHNRIKDQAQFDYLTELPLLEDLEFRGNRLDANIVEKAGDEAYQGMVLQRLPRLKKLDGVAIIHDDDDEEVEDEGAGAGPSE